MPASILRIALIFSIFVLVACGGGGGSSGSGNGGSNPPPSNQPPTVNAGDDQTVNEGDTVTLSGTGTDSDGSISSYVWTQVSGNSVQLSQANMATATFIAPDVLNTTSLEFQLTVTDNDGATRNDTLTITVIPTVAPPIVTFKTDEFSIVGGAELIIAVEIESSEDIKNIEWQYQDTVFTPTSETNVFSSLTTVVSEQTTTILKVIVTDRLEQSTEKSVIVNILPGFSGSVVDKPISSAAVIVSENADFSTPLKAATDSNGDYQLAMVLDKEIYYVKSQGGNINGVPFIGELEAICFKEQPEKCHLTPWSTVIKKIAEKQPYVTKQSLLEVSSSLASTLGISVFTDDPFIAYWKFSLTIEGMNFDAIEAHLNHGARILDWIERIEFAFKNKIVGHDPILAAFFPNKIGLPDIDLQNEFTVNERSELYINPNLINHSKDLEIWTNWSQISGEPQLNLSNFNPQTGEITLLIPEVEANSTIEFELTVTQSTFNVRSTVKINITDIGPVIILPKTISVNAPNQLVITPEFNIPESEIISYEWTDVGNNKLIGSNTTIPGKSFERSTNFVFEDTTSTLRLTIRTQDNSSYSADINVHINTPPQIIVNGEQPIRSSHYGADSYLELWITENESVVVDASLTTDTDQSLSFLWEKLSENENGPDSATTNTLSFSAPDFIPNAGPIIYRLTVTDSFNAQSTTEVRLKIEHSFIPPELTVVEEVNVNAGEILKLTATTNDPDGEVTSVIWRNPSQITGEFIGSNEGYLVEFLPYPGNLHILSVNKNSQLPPGSFEIEVSATDDTFLTTTKTVRINVNIPFMYPFGEYPTTDGVQVLWDQTDYIFGDYFSIKTADFDQDGDSEVLFKHGQVNTLRSRYFFNDSIARSSVKEAVKLMLPFAAKTNIKSVLSDYPQIDLTRSVIGDFDGDNDKDILISLENRGADISALEEYAQYGTFSAFRYEWHFLENQENLNFFDVGTALVFSSFSELYDDYTNNDGTPNNNVPWFFAAEQPDRMTAVDIDNDGKDELISYSSRGNYNNAQFLYTSEQKSQFNPPSMLSYNTAGGFSSNGLHHRMALSVTCDDYYFIGLPYPHSCANHHINNHQFALGESPNEQLAIKDDQISHADRFSSATGNFDYINGANAGLVMKFRHSSDTGDSLTDIILVPTGKTLQDSVLLYQYQSQSAPYHFEFSIKDTNFDGLDDLILMIKPVFFGVDTSPIVLQQNQDGSFSQRELSHLESRSDNPKTLYPIQSGDDKSYITISSNNLLKYDQTENLWQSIYPEPYFTGKVLLQDVNDDGKLDLVRGSRCNGNLSFISDILGDAVETTLSHSMIGVRDIEVVTGENGHPSSLITLRSGRCESGFVSTPNNISLFTQNNDHSWNHAITLYQQTDNQNYEFLAIVPVPASSGLENEFIALTLIMSEYFIIGFDIEGNTLFNVNTLFKLNLSSDADSISSRGAANVTLELIDFDADKDEDILIGFEVEAIGTNFGGTILVLETNEDTFTQHSLVPFLKGADLFNLAIGDVNNDNQPDIVTARRVNIGQFENGLPEYATVLSYFSWEDSTFVEHQLFDPSLSWGATDKTELLISDYSSYKAFPFTLADINNDGYVDFHFGDGYLLNDRGTRVVPKFIPIQPMISHLSESTSLSWLEPLIIQPFLLDTDNDGDLDLIRVGEGMVTLELNSLR